MKKFSPVMIVHLILMVAMACGTIGGAVNFVIGAVNATTGMERFSNLTNVLLMVLILAMLVVGTVYLLQAYGKQAANYYKAFMLIHVGVCALTIFVDLFFYQVTALLIIICALNAIKLLALIALTFVKDLGSQKTWMLFYVVLAMDIIQLVLAIINMAGIGFDFSFTGYVTALVADGTIGLAIRGKYQDKRSRGRD